MRYPRLVILAAVLAVAGGCGRAADDKFAEAAPDFDGLSLEISGAASEGAALVSEESLGQKSQGLGGSGIQYLDDAREYVAFLNGAVKQIVTPIAELVAARGGTAAAGDVMVYGPKDRGTATYRFTIKKQTDVRYGFKLDAKPVGAADGEYVTVMAGAITKGDKPHRGRGALGIDLTALKAIDTTVKGEGKLFCGFGHVGDSKTLVYVLKGFTPNLANRQPLDAAFVGHRVMPSKATRIRIVSLNNLGDSPDPATKELVRTRVRFIPGVGGRADIVATAGDVPVGKAYWGSACWDAQENEGFAILRLCDKTATPPCTIVATRGQLSNCKAGLEAEELPAEGVDDTTLEPEAPVTDVAAPAVMPSGSGE